ncbi:hypothetical protein [Bacillus sp. FJAT-45066]|uniref:hypothetical protein n=1 Tax=Bacillus sp. FJAT-45066 TaxID=2011010 RepID=UPI000BB6D6AF|nr:hypothetical protein [Bacillus sp. FJAT-45066]
MYRYEFSIDGYRVEGIGVTFNHISVPLDFSLKVGGKWMYGTVYYHHYHRTLTFDTKFTDILKHTKEEDRLLLTSSILNDVQEKINKGMVQNHPPLIS